MVREDLPIEHPDFGQLHPCPACRGDAVLESLQAMSRLSDEMLGCKLEDFDPRQHLQRVVTQIRAWFRSAPSWLTMTGPHGTGKTFLMAAIANHYTSIGTPALYTTVADLLEDLKKTFNPNSDQIYSALFADVMEVPVLMLDEAEKWQGTEWAQVQVFRLLEHRSRDLARYRTVLATNTDLRPLLARPGSADLYEGSLFPNYVESRILAGVLITDFWLETDLRFAIGQARREQLKETEREVRKEWEQGELI